MEPAEESKEVDSRSVEAPEWGLWYTLWQRCDKCHDELNFPTFKHPPWNGDVEAWAKHVAPQMVAAGWQIDFERFGMICPNCQADRSRDYEG